MEEIIAAATSGNVEDLRSALANFPHGLNKSYELGRLLFSTMENGHLDCFRLLLNHGARTDLETSSGKSIIHKACWDPFVQYRPFLKVLIARVANLDLETTDERGQTPLHIACRSDNFVGALRLIVAGANINAICQDDETPLHIASACGNEIVELLLDRPEINVEARDLEGNTPLHVACEYGALSSVERLLNKGVELDPFNNADQTPLLVALFEYRLDIFKFLLHHGANPHTRDALEHTPLHLACFLLPSKGAPFVAELLANGADVNATELGGRTPLFIACQFNSVKTLDLLLGAGADATIVSNKGNTPLHVTVKSGVTTASTQRLIVDKLLDANCNPKIRNSSLQRPSDVAIHPEIAEYLRRKEAHWTG